MRVVKEAFFSPSSSERLQSRRIEHATEGQVKTTHRFRIAVVTPFLDKRHGTERRVAEWVSRLADDYDIHIYSIRVEDIDLCQVTWHRIPAVPGPHLVQYLWWFTANHLCRWWDGCFRKLRYDVIYSPGINCMDAQLITVHILFTEFRRQMREELSLCHNPVHFWPRLLHRRLYYRLIAMLERRIYSKPSLVVEAVSAKLANELSRHFHRKDKTSVVYHGIDSTVFNADARLRRRGETRELLGLADKDFVLLLIGNGWNNKGLPCLLEAISHLADLPVQLLVIGNDDRDRFRTTVDRLGLAGRIRFLKPSPDVMQFYAAADVYVGPSLYDSFAFPPAEAMACGLPVITSTANGGSEIITHQMDGLILQDPRDAKTLAELIRRLYEDSDLQCELVKNALRTIQNYTGERNIKQIRQLFQDTMALKSTAGASAEPRKCAPQEQPGERKRQTA